MEGLVRGRKKSLPALKGGKGCPYSSPICPVGQKPSLPTRSTDTRSGRSSDSPHRPRPSQDFSQWRAGGPTLCGAHGGGSAPDFHGIPSSPFRAPNRVSDSLTWRGCQAGSGQPGSAQDGPARPNRHWSGQSKGAGLRPGSGPAGRHGLGARACRRTSFAGKDRGGKGQAEKALRPTLLAGQQGCPAASRCPAPGRRFRPSCRSPGWAGRRSPARAR